MGLKVKYNDSRGTEEVFPDAEQVEDEGPFIDLYESPNAVPFPRLVARLRADTVDRIDQA